VNRGVDEANGFNTKNRSRVSRETHEEPGWRSRPGASPAVPAGEWNPALRAARPVLRSSSFGFVPSFLNPLSPCRIASPAETTFEHNGLETYDEFPALRRLRDEELLAESDWPGLSDPRTRS
jgi:hypothetical protein